MLIAAAPAASQEPAQVERERLEAARERARAEVERRRADVERRRVDRAREHSREERSYSYATKHLDERQWDRAIQAFSEIAKSAASRADGALYWKAYAQNKLGQRTEALATLQELGKAYPNSRWLNDAKALEAEVRQAAGQPVSPETEADEDLKLYALNSLANTDPERAVPMLEKILQGSYAPKLKERALFVLSQSGSPKAKEILGQVAQGKSNPDVQLKAIQYLGAMGGKESRQLLADVYAASNDVSVKRAVLHSFMAAGERDRVLAAAKGEQVPELRREAIHHLGAMGGHAELWQLYGSESSEEIKRQILQALYITRAGSERLVEVARTEKDPKLRREAIRMVATMGAKRTGDVLPSIYAGESDPALRKEVLRALYSQGNVKALIEIARKETDPALKKEAVHHLSLMKSKEATDFMLEILNK